MNIMLQIAGFFVMVVIFIFYFNDRKAAVKTNRLFLYQGISIVLSIFLDISSLVFINTPALTYSIFTYILCKAYLVSCVLVVLLGLLYVFGDFAFVDRRNIFISRVISYIIFAVFTILISVLPLEIYYDPNGLNDYTAGWPVILTYVGTSIFMGMTVAFVFVNRKRMYKKRFVGVLIFISIWVFGAAVQGLVNYLFGDLGVVILCVSFAETLGSLVIYIMLENPALNIDRVTGALTQRAFEEFINSCYEKNINVEFMVIDYDSVIASSIMIHNDFSKALADMLKEFRSNKVFRNDRDDFIVVRNNIYNESLFEEVMAFKEQFYRRNNIVSEIPFKIFDFKDIKLFENPKECMKAIDYLVNNTSHIDKEIIDVNKELVDKMNKRFDIIKKCDIAYSKGNIEVYFQPIYSNSNLSFTSAEALVRLKDEEGNLIYPNDFIEDMERDGRIVELGKMVFADVCKFISENNMEKLGLEYIEVNLSAVQCMQENLASTYISIMEKYKINPKYINLEITETAQSTRLTLLKNMEILKEYGVSFSLDDFGTGNSNLNYMIEMPVRIVKFDKTMVNSYFENRIASLVMNSTIDMIKRLGHKIVFEGVETKDQIIEIATMNVDFIQGYYYSKPIDKNSFISFIESNNK